MKNKLIIALLIVLSIGTYFLNLKVEEKKHNKKLKHYFELHDYYYDKNTNTYKRENLPLYTIDLQNHIYELDAYAKGILINVKYNYDTLQSTVKYTINDNTKEAYYNYKNNESTCNDVNSICESLNYFSNHTHEEFKNILEIIKKS